ncbi:sulfotransferase family protein [Mycobacterium fragae]|uniref:Sulfotransferase family protein n=1 Tax=Mycobacterium fragae TaxID=1260918 RepID=A0A1X1UFN5_9MYCO|nr:sulfotransferase family protein [Mycobacterium fragae]ORV55627.1 hypothetical protein AWC06_03830 [Mycobacterium fragae]
MFVLGTARSGTAALTRVLSLCGGALPPGMLGAMRGNPRGFWEPRAVNNLNDAILYRNGSTAIDPSLRLYEEGVFNAEEKAACTAEIGAFLNTVPAAPLVVIKDPRITLLSDVWFEAARLAEFDVVPVLSVRHPEEVIASIGKHMGASPELANALWLKYTLLAERHTRGLPRVFVEYANLLDDWRREIKRISAVLPIDLNTEDDGAIEEFLEQDLRNQRYCGPVREPFGMGWNSAVYDAMRSAARDDRWDQSVLDCVFEEYRASERAFRTAFEDSREHVNSMSFMFFRPSLLKLTRGVAAMAHRRRGTWA